MDRITPYEPAGTRIADYCGCCGGLCQDAPKGEHRGCCAEQHEEPAVSDLDRFTITELSHLEGMLYRATMKLFDALPPATWTPEYRIARAAAAELHELHREIADAIIGRGGRAGS